MIKDFVKDRGLNRELEALPSEKEIRAAHRGRDRSDLTGTRDADGARQAGAQGRGARQRPARPGGVRRPAAVVLPDQAARPVRQRHPLASAAPGDRHHDAGQRPRRHRGHQLRLPGHPRMSGSGRWTRCAAMSPPTRSSASARCGGRSAPPAMPGVGRRHRSDDAGPAPAHRPRRALAAQLPAAAAGGRRRDQPVRREGGRR